MRTIRTQNDAAWSLLFEKYRILERVEADGSFGISAAQIREFREPRLMAKFDRSDDLPELFRENHLAILPVTRGDYVIGHFDAYHKFERAADSLVRMNLPGHIQSLDPENVSSETMALNCAAASGILSDFLEDENLTATVSGRMGSGEFEFSVLDTKNGVPRPIQVRNAQVEIDAAYEGAEYLSLFEAKREIAEDFLIRQIYYPYRLWKSRVTKPVKLVFLVYSNGIYRLYEYRVRDMNCYNSLKLVKQRNYTVEDTEISALDIQRILDSTAPVPEPEIPFPQADRFERVVNLCELALEQELNRNDVTEQYNFAARQTNYYTDAARYLGLLDKTDESLPSYSLTEDGRCVFALPYRKRQMEFCRRILSHRAFAEALRLYFRRGLLPDRAQVVDIMKRSNLYHVESESTYDRRASTIRGWLNWIVGLINE